MKICTENLLKVKFTSALTTKKYHFEVNLANFESTLKIHNLNGIYAPKQIFDKINDNDCSLRKKKQAFVQNRYSLFKERSFKRFEYGSLT